MIIIEAVEVDQYMWAILTSSHAQDVDEVTIDATGKWKPRRPDEELGGLGANASDSAGGKRNMMKAMSPGSTNMPTTTHWMESNQAMSPYMQTPDMSSLTSDSMMPGTPNNQPQYGSPIHRGPATPSSAPSSIGDLSGMSAGAAQSDFASGGPLGHLSDRSSALDQLGVLDSSVGEQVITANYKFQTRFENKF